MYCWFHGWMGLISWRLLNENLDRNSMNVVGHKQPHIECNLFEHLNENQIYSFYYGHYVIVQCAFMCEYVP